MAKHVAFIRAINVAGHARVKMDPVKAAFAASGCENVTTVIQSGNVVFEAPERGAQRLYDRIRLALTALVGEEAAVMFRPVRHVAEIAASQPFPSDLVADRAIKLYVAFLASPPQSPPSFPIRSIEEKLEAVELRGREAFIVSRRKASGFYGFPNNFIEKELQVRATCRNWSTVTRIARLAG